MLDLESVLSDFLEYIEINNGLSKTTVACYKNDLNKFIKFFSNKTLNKTNLFKYTEEIKGILKPSTINRKLSSIRAFIKFLDHNKSLDLPYEDIHNIRHKRIVPKYFSFDQIRIMFGNSRDGLILLFLYATGLRVSELSNLRISNILFDLGFLRVKGKGSKERMIPVALSVLSMIKNYLNTERPKYVSRYSQDYLFISTQGNKFTRQAIWKIVKKRSNMIGIELSPHNIRHLFAIHLLENGADLKSLQEMLGHKSMLTTQIYTDVTDKILNDEFHKHEILK